MIIRRSGVLAALLAATFVAGCAGNTAPDGAAAPPAAPGSAPASAPADPDEPVVPELGPSGKPSAGGPQTVTGTVTAGVEPNCLILSGQGGPYQLIIDDPAARADAKLGASVTVVGTVDPRRMTTCQQGTPFLVSQVRPA